MRPIDQLLFALAVIAATGLASPAFAAPFDERRDAARPDDHESRYARVERIWAEIEGKRAAIEREHARDVAQAERELASGNDGTGMPAPDALSRRLGELDARRDDELLALEREQYALAAEEEEEDD